MASFPTNIEIWMVAREFVDKLEKVDNDKRWSIARSAIDKNVVLGYDVTMTRLPPTTLMQITVSISFNIANSKVND